MYTLSPSLHESTPPSAHPRDDRPGAAPQPGAARPPPAAARLRCRPGADAPDPEIALTALERAAGEFLRQVDRVQQLVVIRTGRGQAQALAEALDRARLQEAVGTIAGDDTILVVARGARAAATLVKQLKE